MCQTLQPQIITDYVFLHDRGKYNTLYFAFYFGSLAVSSLSFNRRKDPKDALTNLQFSPIVAGLLAEHTGWRNFWWLNVALLGAAFLVSLFCFPETKWNRLRTNDIQTQASQRPNNLPSANFGTNGDATADFEKEILGQVIHPDPSRIQNGKPGKHQFNLFQSNQHPFKSLFWGLWTPFKLFAFPIVDFASFVVSWSASCFLTTNLTQAQAFSANPYKYTPQTIGFFNFAVVIGQVIGLATAGPLSDWISMRSTRRNNGIREPEMRLPVMIPYALIMILGNFVIGFGYEYHWDWRVRTPLNPSSAILGFHGAY